MSPDNEEFLVQRSNIYIDIAQYQNAIDDLTEALTLKPKDP